jgi:hypothetical protein
VREVAGMARRIKLTYVSKQMEDFCEIVYVAETTVRCLSFGSKIKTSRIINLGHNWRWADSLMFLSLFP